MSQAPPPYSSLQTHPSSEKRPSASSDATLGFGDTHTDTHNTSNATTLKDANIQPFILILPREGSSNPILCDLVTNQPLYTIRHTNRSILSSDPDLIISRFQSGKCAPIGSIRLDRKATQIKPYVTGRPYTTSKDFIPNRPLQNNSPASKFTWAIKRNLPDRKTVSDPSKDTQPPSSLPYALKLPDIIVFELTDEAQPDIPLCTVRLQNTEPNGRFEIWTPSACVDRAGGDWAVLDELILSAYASLERIMVQVRRKMGKARYPVRPWEMGVYVFLQGISL